MNGRQKPIRVCDKILSTRIGLTCAVSQSCNIATCVQARARQHIVKIQAVHAQKRDSVSFQLRSLPAAQRRVSHVSKKCIFRCPMVVKTWLALSMPGVQSKQLCKRKVQGTQGRKGLNPKTLSYRLGLIRVEARSLLPDVLRKPHRTSRPWSLRLAKTSSGLRPSKVTRPGVVVRSREESSEWTTTAGSGTGRSQS